MFIQQADWTAKKHTLPIDNELTLSYVETGTPTGEPLLLIHGFSDNSRSWSMAVPYLSRFRLLIPDLRGHGDSMKPRYGYSPSNLATDLVQLLYRLEVPSAHIAGHSFGGMVAQALAAYEPTCVRSMTLLATTTNFSQGPESWLWSNLRTLPYPLDPNGDFLVKWFASICPVDQEFLEYERQEAAEIPRHVWINVLTELAMARPGALNRYFDKNVTILHGDRDDIFSMTDQEHLRSSFMSSEFVVFPNVGHNIQWESPIAAAKEIAENTLRR